MKKLNHDIREKAKACKIPLWAIAERLGVIDVYFSKMLRHELPADEKTKIFAIIDAIAEEEGK